MSTAMPIPSPTLNAYDLPPRAGISAAQAEHLAGLWAERLERAKTRRRGFPLFTRPQGQDSAADTQARLEDQAAADAEEAENNTKARDSAALAALRSRMARQETAVRGPCTIVCRGVGNDSKGEYTRQYKTLMEPLGLHGGGVGLPQARRVVDAFYPWLSSVSARLFRLLETAKDGGDEWLEARAPLLVVGPPGCGKTSWAGVVAGALGMPARTVCLAGVADSLTLGATTRGYSTARPGLFPMTMQETGCANPLLVLDEIEKAGGSKASNGYALDALLPLLEKTTAARHYDSCLCAEVDCSHVITIATANSLEGLSRPLLDRFQVVHAPTPGPEHLEAIIGSIRMREASRLGLRFQELHPLDAVEREWLREILAERKSVRAVVRAYEALTELWNEHAPARQDEERVLH